MTHSGTIGGNYLRTVLGDLVTKIATDKDLNLEVDPRYYWLFFPCWSLFSLRKVNVIEDDYPVLKDLSIASKMVLGEVLNAEDAAEKNVAKLKEVAQAFLDRITDPQMVDEMPKEMKYVVCKCITPGTHHQIGISLLSLRNMPGSTLPIPSLPL